MWTRGRYRVSNKSYFEISFLNLSAATGLFVLSIYNFAICFWVIRYYISSLKLGASNEKQFSNVIACCNFVSVSSFDDFILDFYSAFFSSFYESLISFSVAVFFFFISNEIFAWVSALQWHKCWTKLRDDFLYYFLKFLIWGS